MGFPQKYRTALKKTCSINKHSHIFRTLPPLVQSDSTRTNIPSNFSPREKKVTDNPKQQRLNQGNQDSTEGTEKLTEQMTVLQMLSSSKLSSSSADQILRPLIQDKEIPVVKRGTWGTPYVTNLLQKD